MAKEKIFYGAACFELVDGKFEAFSSPGYSRLGWDGTEVNRTSLERWSEGSVFDDRPILKGEMSRMIRDNPKKFMELHKALKNDPLCFAIAEKVRSEYKRELESILGD